MKTRKLKNIQEDIKKTETELEGLRTELPKAKSRTVDVQVRREKLVYKAKTGNVPTQAKLGELNKELEAAKQEEGDFQTAIKQGEARRAELEIELKRSKEETGKALIAAYAKTLQEEHGPAIDEAIAKVVVTIETKAQEPFAKLRKELAELEFPEVNLERKVSQVITGFLQFFFYRLFPRDFERPHAVYRSKSLAEMFTGAFEMWADKALRQKVRDEAVAIPADFSNMRVIPSAEAEEQVAQRARMREEAAQLKAGVA